MTVRLSPHKITKIMKGYLSGMAQADIAQKAGVDQSTVSIYSSKFRERVSQIGLLAAGREFSVFDEVDALRSLSVELSQADLTVEEAKEGLRIIKAFMKVGVRPEQHLTLIKVCAEINDPGFIQAAVKLNKIEAEANMTYAQVIFKLEKAISELSLVESKLQETLSGVESTTESLTQKRREESKLQAHLQQLHNEARKSESMLKQELATKMKQLKVKLAEVEQVSVLKAELAKSGLDISTLVQLAKEYGKW